MLEDTIEPKVETPVQNEIHTPDDNQETDSLEKIYYGDLYVLGKLWIDILRTGLLGVKWSLPSIIPVVQAAPPPPPKRPPKMKYKDLPVYESPHYEYKDYQADMEKCPKARARLIHEKVLPCVTSYRKHIEQNLDDFTSEVRSMKKDGVAALKGKKNEFKRYMRDCENLRLRQAILALGGASGFYIGYGKGACRPLFFASVGLLATGALCFPQETDDTFRNFTYTTGKFFIEIYNRYCRKNFALRERLPCKNDVPPPPGSRNKNVCPKKK